MPDRIQRIGVLTSGGDSPGSNACIRAVVRMALQQGWQPWGVQEGFQGLIQGRFVEMTSRSVSHVIEQGGTFLGSSRADAFRERQGVREGLRHLNQMGIGALVVIGGDGTMRGAHALAESGFPVMGVPATIENDVYGTDVSIGVDTALNTALGALDRIKDTASSHEQAFLVELAGRKCGYLTLMAGIAGGAEMVCIPEAPFTVEQVVREVADAYVRGKKHCIIVVAAGAKPAAAEMAAYLEEHQQETGFGVRLSILGHIQRGGAPTAKDRYIATRLGAAAVRTLNNGESGLMVGLSGGAVISTPLAEVVEGTYPIDEAYLRMANTLAR